MSRHILIIALLISAALSSWADVMNHDKMFRAYIAGDMDTWGVEIKRATALPLSVEEKLEVLNYLYGYVPTIVEIKEKRGEAKYYIDLMKDYIEEVEEAGLAPALCMVYRVSMLSAQISLNSLSMMTLGPQCLSLTNKALKLEPDNPLTLGLKGNTLFYAPGMFGGNKREALDFYLKSLDAFRHEANPLYKWNEAGMLFCIAEAYEKVVSPEKAAGYCREILKAYPGFTMVKNFLSNLEQ